MGVRVVMLTGDNEKTAKAVAKMQTLMKLLQEFFLTARKRM